MITHDAAEFVARDLVQHLAHQASYRGYDLDDDLPAFEPNCTRRHIHHVKNYKVDDLD